MVVEDEFLIRAMAVEALTEAGFEVLEAEHAQGALGVLRDRANRIRALFTDIHMPGAMNGLDLAHHARTNWPWIRLLLASGLANPHTTKMPAGSRFLSKPYDVAHAVRHIRELFDID